MVVRALTEALIRRGAQVWVFCLSDEVSERFGEIGAHVVTSPHWRRAINPADALVLRELVSFCRSMAFDVVHTHTSKGGFLGRIAARLAGIPAVIHTIHGFSFNELTPWWKTAFYVQLERLASPFCDVSISVTEQHRLLAIDKRIAEPEKIVTIHNGIDLSRFRGAATGEKKQRDLHPSEEAVLIGTVGRLAPEKGQMVLLQAIPTVLREHPEAHLVFVGEGPQEDELTATAVELGIADHCTFLGFRHDVPELLAGLDIFVQPSPREGLSITLLEAMAAGRPVVAADITGNQEVIDHDINGVLCRPMSSTALAEAILGLMEDLERARVLGLRAREKVEAHFDQRVMVEQTLKVYRIQLEKASLPSLSGCPERRVGIQ